MLGSIKAAIAAAATSIKSALPTVVAATTATVVTSSFIYYYTIKDGIYEKESGNVRYVLEKYISQISLDSITKKSGNKGYTYTQDFEKLVDDIIKELDEANSNIEEYTGKTKKDDILKKLIKAEIITQYPDLRSEDEIRKDKEVSENELQGGIKIIRKDSSSDTSGSNLEDIDYKISNNDQILTYIPYSDFNNKITNNEQDIKNHFSIKSSGSNTTSIDIVVAGWTQENTTVTTVEYIPKDDGTGDQTTSDVKEEEPKYTFHEVNINYQNSLSKYSMPAGFLWSLLVMGESTSFVEKLANLAIDNTEIIIEAQDNVTTTVNTNVQKYTYKKDIEKTVILEDGTEETETTSVSAKTESSITTTIVTKQSNTSLNLTYAETWVATYKKEYKNTVNKEQIDDESWKENAEWTDLEDINLGSNTQIQTNDEGEETGKTVVTTYKIANKSATNIQTINTNTYTSAGTNVQERIDIDKDNNFVAYFNKSGRAKKYILQSPDWVYEMLESHEKTANMVDLFKYLLYQSTDNDYGVTTFDFSIINVSNFNSIGSGIIGSSTEEKVWFTLKSKGFSDISIAGVMGNIYGESGFNPSAIESNGEGIGLCQWSFGRKQQLIKYAESKGTTWEDIDTQIEFLLGEINKSGGANGYAQYQMGMTCYGYSYDTWYNAQDTDTATKAFMAVFERPDMSVAHTDRRCSAAASYLKEYEGKTISGGEYVQDGNNGIIGRFTSNITGRTFAVYNQNHSSIGLEGKCNRAVAASIASGYKGTKTEMDVISDVKAGGNNILSNITSTEGFLGQYGLKISMNQYSYSAENMRTILTQGKYIAIWFNGTAIGKSGYKYCGGNSGIHWIGILGYKNENGTEQIFISDPGWGSSGWRDLDEFETCKSTIVSFHTIYEN